MGLHPVLRGRQFLPPGGQIPITARIFRPALARGMARPAESAVRTRPTGKGMATLKIGGRTLGPAESSGLACMFLLGAVLATAAPAGAAEGLIGAGLAFEHGAGIPVLQGELRAGSFSATGSVMLWEVGTFYQSQLRADLIPGGTLGGGVQAGVSRFATALGSSTAVEIGGWAEGRLGSVATAYASAGWEAAPGGNALYLRAGSRVFPGNNLFLGIEGNVWTAGAYQSWFILYTGVRL